MITENLSIDGKTYVVNHRAFPPYLFASTVLCIVSYIPNALTENLIKIAVASVRRYTTMPYTLCVVDNASPEERLSWLRQQPGLVLLENKTPPESGSYANAIGLEIARRIIPQDTRYFMSLHQDIMVTKEGWLEYLLGHFSTRVRAAGVREDKARTPEGILHVLGYVVDLQLCNSLGLDYLPRLPRYDVGDCLIDGLRRHGYTYFVTRNTVWSPEYNKLVPPRFRTLLTNGKKANFSFDDQDDIIFAHFSRGVIKSSSSALDDLKKLSDWNNMAQDLLRNCCPPLLPVEKTYSGFTRRIQAAFTMCKKTLSSVYAHTISFFQRSSSLHTFPIEPNDPRRGYFKLQIERTVSQLSRLSIDKDIYRKSKRLDDLRQYIELQKVKKALVVGCRNTVELDLLEQAGVKSVQGIDLVSQDHRVHICDMHNIIFDKNINFEFIFSSHSLEHALKPEDVLCEFKRILAPGGYVFIEVPIHIDPQGSDLHDFQSADVLEAMLMDVWGGGHCVYKVDLETEESMMGTAVARILFQAPAVERS